jgi:hypothetical protein
VRAGLRNGLLHGRSGDRHPYRPAGILGGLAGGIQPGKPRPAFERQAAVAVGGRVGEIEPGHAVAVGPLLLVGSILRIGIGRHRDLVAQAILVVARPGQRTVGDRAFPGPFIRGMPPAAVDRVDQRRRGEAPWPVAVAVDAMLHDDR